MSNLDNMLGDRFPRVSIIILNWNGWEDTIECLESVYQMQYPLFDVIVVDNGSDNDSIKKIKEYAEGKRRVSSFIFDYSKQNKPIKYIEYVYDDFDIIGENEIENNNMLSFNELIIIQNRTNLGFAEGNNVAIKFAMENIDSEYYLLLNNDTVVDKELLDELLNIYKCRENVGFVGPKTYYYDYFGKKNVLNFCGGKIDLWRGRSVHIGMRENDIGQHDEINKVDYVEGSCLLVKKEVLENIGLLDKLFFTYWEETDLSMKAKKKGYNMFYAPRAKIWHKVSASDNSNVKYYYFTRNRLIFLRRHANKLQLLFFICYFILFDFWYYSGITLCYHKNLREWKQYVVGFYDGVRIKI